MKGSILQNTYLWEATLEQLVVEIVRRKTDNGNPYFKEHLIYNQAGDIVVTGLLATTEIVMTSGNS